MHIMLTVNAAWNIWNFRRNLVASLLEDGHRITVLAPTDEAEQLLIGAGCEFVHLPMDRRGLNPFRDFALLQRFRRIFSTQRPDLILGFTIKNNLYGAIAARKAGIPFIPNVTGLGTAFLGGRLLQSIAETLYRSAFRSAPFVFFQNEDDQALFLDHGLVKPSQARLLPGSGIDLGQFAPAPYSTTEDEPVFLMIGRLLRDKGVFEFVRAARMVRRQHPLARFQLLGPIGSVNRTAIGQEEVEAWQEEGLIEYLGTREDVRDAIAAADCVVLPSYREGAPRTLIEAAAMARPLIATDVAGCRAVVEEGRNGFLCAARDSVSLAHACLRFLALPVKDRRRLGEAARRKMEAEFDQAIVAAAYRDVIDGCVRQAAGTA